MEPERFRSSLLTGGVPVKIVDSRREVPESAPLGYLMMEPGDVGERLTASVFPRLRRRFRDDWRRFPTLGQEIARVLRESGIETDGYSSRAADRRTPGTGAWHAQSPGTKHLLRQGTPGAAPSRAFRHNF